ncbi:MAG: hypothetical protein WCF99_09675 [Chloroflexales bacterium]
MSISLFKGDIGSDQEQITLQIPLQVIGLSAVYAAVLSGLERRFPIKPDHTWAEVAGGVVISLLPVALEARRKTTLDWRTYETVIWLSFFASGVPIILWQLGEAMLRQLELLRYTGSRERRSIGCYADNTTAMALRGRGRAGERDSGGERGDAESTPGAEHPR